MTNKEENKINKFLKLFEIEDLKTIEEDYIHKKYKKLALKLHPDKGGNKEDFQELQESYDTLLLLHSLDNKNDTNECYYISNILQSIQKFQSKYKEPISKMMYVFSKNFSNLSLQYLESLDLQSIQNLFLFLQKSDISRVLNKDVIDRIEKIINKKKNKYCIYKKIVLSDILDKNVFKFNHNNQTYFAPMWHSEVEFESEEGENFCLQFVPLLPDNIWIDENNNLNIYWKTQINNLLIYNDYLSIDIENMSYNIPCNNIVCKKNQIIKLKGQGLWKIQENNMFDVKDKTDVVIHLELE